MPIKKTTSNKKPLAPKVKAQLSSPSKSESISTKVKVPKTVVSASKAGWFFIGTLIFLLLALFIYVVVAYSQNLDKTEARIEQLEMIIEKLVENGGKLDSSGSVNYNFKGKFLQASLPQGWALNEYTNGQGTGYLSKTAYYTGLTGFELTAPNGDKALVAQAYDMDTAEEACDTYYQFPDDNKDFAKNVVGQTLLEFGVNTEVMTIAADKYEDISLLGAKARRSERMLLFDAEPDKEGFSYACGKENSKVIALPDAFFKRDGEQVHTYRIEIMTSSRAQLDVMDDVLKKISSL